MVEIKLIGVPHGWTLGELYKGDNLITFMYGESKGHVWQTLLYTAHNMDLSVDKTIETEIVLVD